MPCAVWVLKALIKDGIVALCPGRWKLAVITTFEVVQKFYINLHTSDVDGKLYENEREYKR